MNKIDLSNTGGFPLDEDALDFLQAAHASILNRIHADAGATPTIISGMEYTGTTGTLILVNNYNAGLFFYNGELYEVPAGSASNLLGGATENGVAVGETAPPTLYEDGNSHNVFKTRVGAYTDQVPGSPGFIPMSSFKHWHEVLGIKAKKAPAILNTAVWGVPQYHGDLSYIKNELTNTVHIWGTVSVDIAQNLPTAPTFPGMFILPLGCRPTNKVPFSMPVNYNGGLMKDYNGSTLTSLSCHVLATGDVCIGFIKPDVAVTDYSLDFNLIIPLD